MKFYDLNTQGRRDGSPKPTVFKPNKERFFLHSNTPLYIHVSDRAPRTENTATGRAKLTLNQGRIHGNLVADGWAGAVMRKPPEIQECDGPTDGPTDRHGKV